MGGPEGAVVSRFAVSLGLFLDWQNTPGGDFADLRCVAGWQKA
jgi:hypothetical protein